MGSQKQQLNYLRTNVDKKEIHPNITHGYAGLRNQGATCYLNAVLQTLFMTKEFRNAVESSQDNYGLSFELEQLFKRLKSDRRSVTTERITHVLKIENVNEQQDAAQWFLRILNMISPDMSKTFQGILEYTTICKNPKNEHLSTKQIDHFFSMPISMDSHSSINVKSCLKLFFEPVYMCGEDKLYCTTCKNMMNMETNCKIQKFPPVLVLHLKRFELDYNTMYYRKNTSKVEIPIQLSVKGERAVRKYDLYAVVKHVGSLRSGHYFADIKSFEDQQWYRFDDCSVQKIPDLKNHCEKAYLLLYKCAAVVGEAGLPCSQSEKSRKGNRKAKYCEMEGIQKQTKRKTSCESKNPLTKTNTSLVLPGSDHQPQSEIEPYQSEAKHDQSTKTQANNKGAARSIIIIVIIIILIIILIIFINLRRILLAT